MQFDYLVALNELGKAFFEYMMNWVFSLPVTVIALLLALIFKPSLVFWLTKLTFRFRKASHGLHFEAQFHLDFDELQDDIQKLAELLDKTKYFRTVQVVNDQTGDSIHIAIELDEKNYYYDLLRSEDTEEGVLEGFEAVHEREISYSDIGNFVDFTVAARDRIYRAFVDAQINPRALPSIVIRMSWNSRALSILPWLKRDYDFVGSIRVKDSDISITHTERGATVMAGASTPQFKDILRNLVVANMTR